MSTLQAKAKDFLAQKRIAVVGVARKKPSTGAAIFKALSDRGYEVYAVNPNADSVEGKPCYPSVRELPEKVDGVMVVTRPAVSEQVMRDCVEAGIPRVWMHYNPMFGKGNSSASDAAATYGEAHGLTVIAGGCPMMFLDFPHKCMHWLLRVTGSLPK